MLFRREFLDGIAAGTVTVAFRRWEHPRVRAGSRQRTPIGVVEIDSVEVVDESRITDRDARRAGHRSRAELLAELARRPAGTVYRIRLHLAGPDPRLRLREQADLTGDDLAAVRRRLARMDETGRAGAWTGVVLRLIRDHPAVRAPDLAARLGWETLAFKRNVRKLKELGLTESLAVGYRLSPRGRTVLGHLDSRDPPPPWSGPTRRS